MHKRLDSVTLAILTFASVTILLLGGALAWAQRPAASRPPSDNFGNDVLKPRIERLPPTESSQRLPPRATRPTTIYDRHGHRLGTVFLDQTPAAHLAPSSLEELLFQPFDTVAALDADAITRSQFSPTYADVEPCDDCGDSPCTCEDSLVDKVEAMVSFWDKVDISGHVRVRHETSWDRINRPTRNRGRLRARLAATYKPNDEIEAGIRFTTGDRRLVLEPGDRSGSVLSYQDTGDVFDKFAFNLDRIFITWKPAAMPNLFVTGGKFKHPVKLNPILSSPMGSLGFDEAVHPEGVAGGFTWDDYLGMDKLKFVAGETVVLELGNQDEASMFFAHVWAEKQMSETWKLEGGVTWYDWHNLNPDGNTTVTLTNFGNATNAAPGVAGTLGAQIGVDMNGDPIYDGVARRLFRSRFNIINPMAVLTYDDGDECSGLHPVQFVYEAFQNTEAFSDSRDFGYTVGVQYGPAVTRSGRQQGDWKVWYTWQEVQQDSVLTPVAQDDFQLATNFRGHFIGLDYFPWDQVEVRFWALSDEPIVVDGAFDDPDLQPFKQQQWRGRVDITVYF
ncbi:MAG: putative porin [Planctomycetes bacterium]|nr:putative porin [Planctomycetota bacterium]